MTKNYCLSLKITVSTQQLKSKSIQGRVIEWVGLEGTSSNPLPQSGTPSSRPGCSKLHLTWPGWTGPQQKHKPFGEVWVKVNHLLWSSPSARGARFSWRNLYATSSTRGTCHKPSPDVSPSQTGATLMVAPCAVPLHTLHKLAHCFLAFLT